MPRFSTIAGPQIKTLHIHPAAPLLALIVAALLVPEPLPAFAPSGVQQPIIFTQLERVSSGAAGSEPRARIVRLDTDGSLRLLTESFHSASDPSISFDGQRILFAARKASSDRWQIYEMDADGAEVRRITDEAMDCRSPLYQSSFYVITGDQPWHQISFIGSGPGLPPNLYSTRLDGTERRRLTFNPYGDADPFLMSDGRILFSSRQSYRLEAGPTDRQSIFGVNLGGTDYAVYAADEGAAWKRMPAETAAGLVVFVENSEREWDGAGWLAGVAIRRNLHSHRRLSAESDGLYHSPSALDGSTILVSRRPTDGSGSHGLFRFDLSAGSATAVYDDPDWHDIQAQLLRPRPEPDGRSSVVTESDPTGILYALDVHVTDLKSRDWIPTGSALRLRVVEGLPRVGGSDDPPAPPARRRLGEFDIEADGSFQIRVPANTPLQLQLLDEAGLALRTCSWIWVKNREPRGCIGCHEDNELAPENRLVGALTKPAVALTLPPERRRRITYRQDILPIFKGKCSDEACHGGGVPPRLDDDGSNARLHISGAARTSPLAWRLFGRNTSRPWDPVVATDSLLEPMPPEGHVPLTDDERRTILEWIDLGAE